VTPGPARAAVNRWGPPLLVAVVLLAAWESYVRAAGVSPVVLPGPLRVGEALWTARDDAVRNAVPTILEAAIGFAASVTFAVVAAILLDRVPPLRRAIEPLFVGSQTIPIVAVAPLFVLWFGFGLEPKIIVVVLVTFFPIVVALLDGFARVEPAATDLLASYGATGGQTFRLLRWPAALPALFTGLRISVVYALIAAVFGEYVGAYEGLGIWMKVSQNAFRTDLVFAAILVTAVLSIALFALVRLVERMVIPWAPGIRA